MRTGGGPETRNGGARTPIAELARIRASQERRNDVLRERIVDSMLEECGRRGFREVTVQDAIDAAGTNRVQFYRHFASKAQCYETAHEERLEQLCERVLGAGAGAPDWCGGLCAGLRALADEVTAHPLRMRGLLVEVHVAGGSALTKRAEVLERFAFAVDRGRFPVDDCQLDPSSLTAAFMVRAVDAAVTRALLEGDPRQFSGTLPELAQLVAAPYGKANGPKEMGNLLRAAMLA